MQRQDPRSSKLAYASPEAHTQSEVGCPRAHAMDLRHGTPTRLVCPAASPNGCLPAPCRRHPVLGTPRLPRPDVPPPSPLHRPRRPSPRWRVCSRMMPSRRRVNVLGWRAYTASRAGGP
ncbi:hypothetical protein VPH35_020702 [Triticum aestivum]